MHTIISGLLAGLVVGIVCVIYALLRTKRMENDYETGKGIPYSEGVASTGLLIMAMFGSGSLVWGFVGAGIYHLIRDDLAFLSISVAMSLLIILWIWRSKTTFATDKILLTLIIFVGLGFLIPWFYDTLKVFA
jgi:hypothetical protein